MRLLPRSTCAIAVVMERNANASPKPSATSPVSSEPSTTAEARASSEPPPGETASIVAGHDPGRPVLVDVGGEAGERDQERYDGQAGLERQGAAVGEAVAVPEPHERVDRDPAQSVAAGEVPGVLGVELVAIQLGRDRDGAGSAHAGRLCARMGQDAAGPARLCP